MIDGPSFLGQAVSSKPNTVVDPENATKAESDAASMVDTGADPSKIPQTPSTQLNRIQCLIE
ncbi:hypothetical protein PGTUg99_013097 [Puccinia graminis f. sp. tritici]|uniref:Uncharacterized protein n=1 Tax=Puccinia graminis f. sp. tritici TaxID=56615 RepID=A0A5B0Q0V5_PUCGR|nr:hypothetical protein PGTUg99_013097 [Puccinia graminis f. sp. tritici]